MDNFRKSLIEELMLTLKIPQGSFNYGTIADEISFIPNNNLRDFYKRVMTSESFGNGMKAIIETAEQFKPIQQDTNKLEAKRLIKLVESINAQVFKDSEQLSIPFSDLIDQIKLIDMISENDLAVLNQVKPYCSHKLLVSNISAYQTSLEQLQAFKNALEFQPNESLAISDNVRKMIGSK